MANGVKRRCWKCLMFFGNKNIMWRHFAAGNKNIMWRHFAAGNNDCPPPLGAPSELKIAKQRAVEKRANARSKQRGGVETFRAVMPGQLEELTQQVKYNIYNISFPSLYY